MAHSLGNADQPQLIFSDEYKLSLRILLDTFMASKVKPLPGASMLGYELRFLMSQL